MGISEQFCDSVCYSVIVKLYLVLYRSGGFQNGFQQGICSVFPCHVSQESHGNANVEIQGIDCLEFPDSEVFKVEYLLLCLSVLLSFPTNRNLWGCALPPS